MSTNVDACLIAILSDISICVEQLKGMLKICHQRLYQLRAQGLHGSYPLNMLQHGSSLIQHVGLILQGTHRTCDSNGPGLSKRTSVQQENTAMLQLYSHTWLGVVHNPHMLDLPLSKGMP